MYTISLRPYCPGGIPKQCMNFVQEQLRWDLSTFSEESQPPAERGYDGQAAGSDGLGPGRSLCGSV